MDRSKIVEANRKMRALDVAYIDKVKEEIGGAIMNWMEWVVLGVFVAFLFTLGRIVRRATKSTE